jgi:hypothetical protein
MGKLENIDIGKYFLNKTPIAQEISIDKWDCIRLKDSTHQNYQIKITNQNYQ